MIKKEDDKEKSQDLTDYKVEEQEIEDQKKEKNGKGGNNSYRNIIKSSSFFGGVQIFNILINLIRGKFVAIILGPEGMGIAALFNSALNTIQKFSGFGLNQSIIRGVAENGDDIKYKEKVVKSSLYLTNITSLIGLIISVVFCVPLSRLTFGDVSYWWQFMILGVGVFFAISGTGKLAILQGLHEVKRISKASIVGGLVGLGVGIPLYYIFGYHGIVPGIVAVFLALYIFYSVNLKRILNFSTDKTDWKIYIPIAKQLLALGLVLMGGDLIGTLVGYSINLFIRRFGSIDDVGLYQAANSVTNQFTGMIFAALAMDYFPRLTQVSSDNKKMIEVVNRQSEVVSWLMTPAIVALILTTPFLIRLLLSESFQSVTPLMRWMGLGMLLRGFSFPMAYITFAKGNKKVFFLLEGVLCNVLTFVLSCVFFHWFGLIGLGYALVADNGLCIIIYYLVNNRLYGYNFSLESIKNYTFGGLLVGGCFVFSFFDSGAISYSLMGVFCGLSLLWAFRNIKRHYIQ